MGCPRNRVNSNRALVRLEGEHQALEAELVAATARRDDTGSVDEIADALLGALSGSREVLEAGEPEERKRLVRAFLRGIDIRKPTRQVVLSWFRLPAPENLSVKLVAPTGFEPVFQVHQGDGAQASGAPVRPPS